MCGSITNHLTPPNLVIVSTEAVDTMDLARLRRRRRLRRSVVRFHRYRSTAYSFLSRAFIFTGYV